MKRSKFKSGSLFTLWENKPNGKRVASFKSLPEAELIATTLSFPVNIIETPIDPFEGITQDK